MEERIKEINRSTVFHPVKEDYNSLEEKIIAQTFVTEVNKEKDVFADGLPEWDLLPPWQILAGRTVQ